MNHFLISLSHSYMYGRGNVRVLEGVLELRTRLHLSQDSKRNGPRFFMKVDACSDCRHQVTQKFVIEASRKKSSLKLQGAHNSSFSHYFHVFHNAPTSFQVFPLLVCIFVCGSNNRCLQVIFSSIEFLVLNKEHNACLASKVSCGYQ